MVRCPNCGQKTTGDHCQWCNYPILRGSPTRHREAEKQAEKEAKEAQKAAQDIGSEIYEGNVELVVPSAADFKQVRQFEERLKEFENLRIVWVGGSVDKGTIVGVSVQKPMILIRILNKMPMVEKVDKKGEKIVVMLKTPRVS